MRHNRRHSSGFTIVELMIVIFLVSLIIYSINSLFTTSAAVHKLTGDSMLMQSNLRFAIEQLKTDLRNAGFQVTPNIGKDDNVCQKTGLDLRALQLSRTDNPFTDSSLKEYVRVNNPNVAPMAITLLGDLRIGKSWFTKQISGSTVYIKDGPTNENEFKRTFSLDSYLRIVNHDQYSMIFKITAVEFSTKSISISGTPPIVGQGQPCGVDGLGENQQVNVVDYVRYRVIADPADTNKRKTLLVKELLKHDGKTVRTRGVTVIAENVIDMQFYDFVFDNDTTREAPVLDRSKTKPEQVVDTAGAGLLGTGGSARPEDLRMMTVVLTVRAPSEDRYLNHVEKTTAHQFGTTFDLLSIDGACRTMSIASKLELRSLAVRNMKPGK